MKPGPLLSAHIAVDPPSARKRLVALHIADPPGWRAIVREALEVASAAGMGKPEAAALLGVGRRTLYDWVDADQELTEIATAIALPSQGGPGHRSKRGGGAG